VEIEKNKDTIRDLVKILKDREQKDSIWIKTEEVPRHYKLKDDELVKMTQKKAYKMILKHRKRQPDNNPTTKRIEKIKKTVLKNRNLYDNKQNMKK